MYFVPQIFKGSTKHSEMQSDFFNKLSPLRVDTESLAVKLCLKVVQIAKAASIPELCTSIGFGVIVPPDNIVPTWSRLETLNTISN